MSLSAACSWQLVLKAHTCPIHVVDSLLRARHAGTYEYAKAPTRTHMHHHRTLAHTHATHTHPAHIRMLLCAHAQRKPQTHAHCQSQQVCACRHFMDAKPWAPCLLGDPHAGGKTAPHEPYFISKSGLHMCRGTPTLDPLFQQYHGLQHHNQLAPPGTSSCSSSIHVKTARASDMLQLPALHELTSVRHWGQSRDKGHQHQVETGHLTHQAANVNRAHMLPACTLFSSSTSAFGVIKQRC